MKTPHWFILFNPAAASGRLESKWPELEKLLQVQGFNYTVKFTQHRGHGIDLVEEAILKGHRHIIAVGGDGTNHEAINGIFKQKRISPTDVYYALIPFGSGNDWARHYKLEHNFAERLSKIQCLETKLQDIGWVQYQTEGQTHERYFTNVAGMAYDGYLVQQIASQKYKPAGIQYLWMVLRYLFRYKLRKAQIQYDNRKVEDFFYTINVGICPYSGGGMQIVPQAIPDDGLLALTFARQIPQLEVLIQTHRFYNGSILKHPKVTGLNTEGPIRVNSLGDQPTLLEADGEFLGEAPAEFRILPKALHVVV